VHAYLNNSVLFYELVLRLLRLGLEFFDPALERLLTPFATATDFLIPFPMHSRLTPSRHPVSKGGYTFLSKDRNQGTLLPPEPTRYCGPIIFLLGGDLK